jgi:hypothetical protein
MKLRRPLQFLRHLGLLYFGICATELCAQAQDGNTLANAIQLGPIGITVSRSGTLAVEDSKDYYHFKVTESVRAVRVAVPAAIAPNAHVRLLTWPDPSADPVPLAAENSNGSVHADFTLWLDPGDYYIEVSSDSANRTYTLQVSQVVQTASKGNHDNRLALARSLGAITTALSLEEFVGATDAIDYFHFKVEGSVRAVRILVPAAIAPNAHVRLLTWPDPNADPVPLAAENSNGSTHADFTLWLDPGDYYIEVSSDFANPLSSNRFYELKLSQVVQPASQGKSDNRLAQARPLGSITTATSVAEYIGAADAIDYFHFRVEGSVRAVRILVPAAIAPNAHVRLLTWPDPNSDPVPLAAENSNGSTHADFTLWLDPGDYYIEVSSDFANPLSSNRFYELKLSQVIQTASQGISDNRLAQARPLGSITTATSVAEYIGAADAIDYFHFRVEGSVRAVRILVPAAIAPNAHVRLLTWPDPNSDPVPLAAENSNGSTHADFITNLPVGNYYIEVSSDSANPLSANRLYELELSQTLPPKTAPFVMKALEHSTAQAGQPAGLRVLAEGSPTLSYQWHFNGAPIAGATLPQLRFASVQASNAGSYTVTVTNEFGSVTSTAATLTVTPPSLALDIAPAVIISWPVVAEGVDIAQWILDRGASVDGPWNPATPVVRTIANDRVHFAVPVERADNVLFRLRRP